MTTLPKLRLLAAALALTTASAQAALPYPVKSGENSHPRVLATSADLEAFKRAIPTAQLPLDAGTVELSFTPGKRAPDEGTIVQDQYNPVIFGNDGVSGTPQLFIKHFDNWDAGDKIGIQVGLQDAQGGNVALGKVMLTAGVPAKIKLSYNKATKTATLDVEGGTRETWPAPGTQDWAPTSGKPQPFQFIGRKNDKVESIKVLDGSKNPVWTGTDIDWDLGASYVWFLKQAKVLKTTIDGCQAGVFPGDKVHPCNIATAGRNSTIPVAKRLALAYKLTNDDTYVTAAKKYIAHISSLADKTAGTEWSMSARVGAMGIIYDWFFAKLNESERAQVRAEITATINADIPNSDKDLIGQICGTKGQWSPSLRCDNPNIERSYISGHQASAMTSTAMGLLAIANEQDVTQLLGVIYDHMENGQIPAREYISADGGHQTLFAYGANAGEVLERYIMWRRALAVPSGEQILETNSASKLIDPFIYAMRGSGAGKIVPAMQQATSLDQTFPATGDNFDVTARDPNVGYMALAAASAGRGEALSFYQKYIRQERSRLNEVTIWDVLMYPEVPKQLPAVDLPLAKYMRVSGNVFMRDTWDYDRATLVDFKSSAFSSENHQHLDQNSFSLFYKAPLLVDSGVYDEYNTSHWYNYYRRTIAHNSIVVFDPAEEFKHSADGVVVDDSNDGGQWYKGDLYPTLADITKGANAADDGINVLDGIGECFEEGGDYAYVCANAGRAYRPAIGTALPKLDPADGFKRSLVYLRPAGSNSKPIVLTFDRIHSPKKLPATLLLHSATRPQTSVAQTYDTNTAAGRYKVESTSNVPLVIRNGGGMLTVEPILPQRAKIKVVGGGKEMGVPCEQFPQLGTGEAPELGFDCRFTVRRKVNGVYKWVNARPWTTYDKKELSDVGAWRIEIAPVDETVETATYYQFFLNVLRVGDDVNTAVPTANTATLLTSSNNSANGVDVDATRAVVFATDFKPSDGQVLRWTPKNRQVQTLVFGVLPNTQFTFKPAPTATYPGEYALAKAVAGTSGTVTSSAAGVVVLPPQ